MDIIIRKLEKGDYEKGFLETLSNLSTIGDVSKEKFLEILAGMEKRGEYFVFVAELDGKVVGTATLMVQQLFAHSGGRVGHIENVVTRKGFEGRGIGSRLMERVIEESKVRGCYKIILSSDEKNAGFYKRFGFQEKEIAMRLDLH
ncbi:MAG: GNAT family N-acetyltransferase [Patescibacteria group bacterium]